MQLETTNQVSEFMVIMKRRRWQIILPALFVLSLGSAFAVIVPKKYPVNTTIELIPPRYEGDPMLGNPQQTAHQRELQNAQFQVANYVRILRVIEDLDWEDYTQLPTPQDKKEYIERIRDSIEVGVRKKAKDVGSTFVDVKYSDTDPRRAEELLSGLVSDWIEDIISRDRDTLQRERDILQNERDESQRMYHEALAKQEEIQKQMGTSWTQDSERDGPREEDPVFAELKEARRERERALADKAQVEAQLANLQERLLQEPETRLKLEQIGGTDYAVEIKEKELQVKAARFELEQGGYLPAHSKYQLLHERISQLEEEIRLLEELGDERRQVPRYEPNPERERLQTAILDQQAELRGIQGRINLYEAKITEKEGEHLRRIELNSELVKASAEVSLWRELYNQAQERFRKKQQVVDNIQLAPNNPFRLVEPALADTKPTEPNPYLIVGFCFFAGLALGVGSAAISEFSRNVYRGVGDVSAVISVPVLGVVNQIITKSQRRRAFVRRALVGASCAVVLAGMVFFTWLYATDQKSLPSEVLVEIDRFRMLFR